MKLNRTVLFKLIILATICFSSCSNVKNELVDTNDSQQQKLNDNVTKSASEPGKDENEKYSVTGQMASKKQDDLNYTIKYPQISGLADKEKQNKINKIIETEALKVLNYYKDPTGLVEININYTVTSSSNILSIQYSGLGNVSNAAHPNNIFYTTNIDIKCGERIRLKDIIDTGELANKFISGQFKALIPEQSEFMGIDEMRSEQLQKDFQKADSLDSIGTKNQTDVFSYFTKDALGISMPVPFAIGNHAEFEIEYDNIKEIMMDDSVLKELIEKK